MKDTEKALGSSRLRLALTDPIFVALAVLACVLAGYGVYAAAGDPAGVQSWSMPLAILAPAIPTSWSVAKLIWANYPPNLALTDALVRILGIPFVVALPTTIVAVVVVKLPVVAQLIEKSRRPDDGWHYFFPLEDGSPLTLVLMGCGLLGFTAGILAGLIVWVFAVLPAMAFGAPAKFAEVNQLDTSPRFAETNALASKTLSVFLMLTFLIPTLIIFGKEEARAGTLGQALTTSWKVFSEPQYYWGDMAWVLGAVLIPIGVVLLVVTKMFQKPDKNRSLSTRPEEPTP